MFYYNGESHELPKKTMALNDKIEAVNNAKTTGEAYRRMLDFVVSGLGEEKVKELIKTTDIMEVDLTELNKLADAIIIGYDQEVNQQRLEQANRVANSNAVKNLIDAGKSAQYLQSIKK